MRTYCNKQRTIEVCRGAHAHAGALIPPHERLIQIRRGWLKIKRNVKKKKKTIICFVSLIGSIIHKILHASRRAACRGLQM